MCALLHGPGVRGVDGCAHAAEPPASVSHAHMEWIHTVKDYKPRRKTESIIEERKLQPRSKVVSQAPAGTLEFGGRMRAQNERGGTFCVRLRSCVDQHT